MKIASLFASCVPFALLAAASLQAQTDEGSGTKGTIPVWTGSNEIGNSIISQAGTEVTVKGTVTGTSSSDTGVRGQSTSATGVLGISSSGYGVDGGSTSSYGVVGSSGSNSGVFGLSDSGSGVNGESTSGFGVKGSSGSLIGVYGTSKGGIGVEGVSNSSSGVTGVSESLSGVFGQSTSGIGVEGSSTSNVGVQGTSDTEVGVLGQSTSLYGVEGQSKSSIGVRGLSETRYGVAGISTSGNGVGGLACSSCSGAAAIYGDGKLAGAFDGDVGVTGDFSVVGVKAFHIDHPLDPANKYLNHFAMESDEVLNSYSGNVTTDERGTATVELPNYFEVLNKDYRYQLTVIGQFAQAIVAQEIENNRFVIRTDKPSVKVSWQVTGVRSDAYVKAHPMPVEQEKPEQERGYYLAPELFGQPEDRSIAWLYHGDMMREAKAMEERRQAEAEAARLQKPGVGASGRD